MLIAFLSPLWDPASAHTEVCVCGRACAPARTCRRQVDNKVTVFLIKCDLFSRLTLTLKDKAGVCGLTSSHWPVQRRGGRRGRGKKKKRKTLINHTVGSVCTPTSAGSSSLPPPSSIPKEDPSVRPLRLDPVSCRTKSGPFHFGAVCLIGSLALHWWFQPQEP